MVFRQRQREKTAKHLAVKGGKTKILEKLCEWAKEAIPHVKNKLFLDQDRDGYTGWHLVAKSGKAEVWESIWYWDKEDLT
jgi:hypothetical protein